MPHFWRSSSWGPARSSPSLPLLWRPSRSVSSSLSSHRRMPQARTTARGQDEDARWPRFEGEGLQSESLDRGLRSGLSLDDEVFYWTNREGWTAADDPGNRAVALVMPHRLHDPDTGAPSPNGSLRGSAGPGRVSGADPKADPRLVGGASSRSSRSWTTTRRRRTECHPALSCTTPQSMTWVFVDDVGVRLTDDANGHVGRDWGLTCHCRVTGEPPAPRAGCLVSRVRGSSSIS